MVFELNSLDNIEIKEINGTRLYIKDNFYKNPYEIVSMFKTVQPKMWKSWDKPTYNGVHFLDSRHDFYHAEMLQVGSTLEKLCGQKVAQPGRVVTNCIQFYDKNFNDYQNNYWGPHEDLGYTALVYLNEFDCSGTNIYNRLKNDIWETPEHYEPWRSKDKFELLYTVESKFNRMILFDGNVLTHGMSINDDTFFYKTRINQAIFFIADS